MLSSLRLSTLEYRTARRHGCPWLPVKTQGRTTAVR
jgi:hypothetical protein